MTDNPHESSSPHKKKAARQSSVVQPELPFAEETSEEVTAVALADVSDDGELLEVDEFVEFFAEETSPTGSPLSIFRLAPERAAEALAANTDGVATEVKIKKSKAEAAPEPEAPVLLKFEEALTLEGQVEAVVFAAPKPVQPAEILDVLQDDEMTITQEQIEAALNSLMRLYGERAGGFRLEHLKGEGYQFRTVPAAMPIMERLFTSRPRPLSRAALETLAIIAYRQPVTRADVEHVRGVDAGSAIKNLLDRNMIQCVGRKEDAGRPMLFGTTDEFLKVFRVPSLSQLPPLSSFQPSPELMAEARNKLENSDQEIDVEGFVGDEEYQEGQVVGEESLEEAVAVSEVELTEDDRKEEAMWAERLAEDYGRGEEVVIKGAQFDKEGFDEELLEFEENGLGESADTDSEMDVGDGDSIPPRGRDMDQGGEDQG